MCLLAHYVPTPATRYAEAVALVGKGAYLYGSAVLKRLTSREWYLCEGCNAAPILTLLVVALYRELPRWEFNGWPEVEYLDMRGYPCLIERMCVNKHAMKAARTDS